MNDRVKLLRQQMARRKLAVFLVTKSESVRWLSGYTGQDSATLLVTPRRKFLMIMQASYRQACREAKGWQVVNLNANPRKIISQTFKKCPGQRLGFEETIPFNDLALYKRLDGNNRRHYIATEHFVKMLRMIKTPAEIKLIRQACQMTDEGFRFACRILRPGLTEAELSWRLERFLRDRGADQRAFRFVVSFGVNTCSSHHEATSRRLKPGDIILLDFGIKYRGYVSDITRTMFFGKPNKKLAEIYHHVYRVQQAALASIRRGITAWELHHLVENMMRTDYRWVIPHAIGHGIGLEVHELPHFGWKKGLGTNIPLEPNMTFTIEPGIYLPKLGGVRIEDDVLMTAHGYELLTRAPKKFEEMIISPRISR